MEEYVEIRIDSQSEQWRNSERSLEFCVTKMQQSEDGGKFNFTYKKKRNIDDKGIV